MLTIIIANIVFFAFLIAFTYCFFKLVGKVLKNIDEREP
jgi:hypothetical protein